MEQYRDLVVESIRSELFGPAGGEEEVIAGRPMWRYLCGMLFPSGITQDDFDEQDEDDPRAIESGTELEDPAVQFAYDTLPAAMGISFYLEGAEEIHCDIEAARYLRADDEDIGETEGAESSKKRRTKKSRQDIWCRQPLATQGRPESESLICPRPGASEIAEREVLGGKARLSAYFRPRGQGHLVTVSLTNTQEAGSGSPASNVEGMLFQVRFHVRIDEGGIGEYPSVVRFSRHPEDEELSLVYRDRKPHGIGHGCAAVWDPVEAREGLRRITAEPLPVFEIRPLTNRIEMSDDAGRALSLQWLANPETPVEEIANALDHFVGSYEQWVESQEKLATELEEELRAAAARLVERQRRAIDRMRRGRVALTDPARPKILEAFKISQEAMLRQFLWVRRNDSPRDLGEGEVDAIDHWDRRFAGDPLWRPFQLAFQLLVLESLVNPDSDDRPKLDLLWFPTGGGKTEAYLALVAFEIVYRRLEYSDAGGGTVAITRYTLRLLTTQQFERASALISVLEVMRHERDYLGGEPITLGLWVGAATTPNQLDCDNEFSLGAKQLMDGVLEDDTPENPFHLRACPCCGTRIIPERKSPREADYGVEVTAASFKFFCPDERCLLHDRIPVSVVDEDLFRNAPTFLIGTIDKFARMAWDARSRVFLGCGNGGILPPALIIQDELHLITGPLGTIAGLYESAVDTVLRLQGAAPKYLAATATIQRATEQCKTLYARDAAVFPPQGLEAGDSYFSREDSTRSGRTYIGVMGHGMYSSLTSLVQASASAAHAVTKIPKAEILARDSFWTQVIYHNSRQELGKTTTMMRDDVRSRMEILQPLENERRTFDKIEELSANLKGPEVSRALERLATQWPSESVIDAVACTNMLSVGIDVARLGLMIVKSQPKSTAEYIQASSRVGRDKRRPPGVVMALYSANRPRDRSHYETFQSYHQALYRGVEPSSITPFSPPARERALHAALVIALRLHLGWIEPRDAKKFDVESSEVRQVIETLRSRLSEACRVDEREEVAEHLERVIGRWSLEVLNPGPNPLSFGAGRQFKSLLTQFPTDNLEPNGIWPTLNSMRHVDGEVPFRVRGERSGASSEGTEGGATS